MNQTRFFMIMVTLIIGVLARPVLAVTVLTFEDFTSFQSVGDFFDGGTNADGVTGPDLGITFTDAGALTLDGISAMFWEDGPTGPAIFDVDNGFESGLAIRVATSPAATVFIAVIGIDGEVLAQKSQLVGNSLPGALEFVDIGLEFDGIAGRVFIGDSVSDGLNAIVTNITLGDATVVPIPAAGWLLLGGLATLWQRGRGTSR